jgi:hypothetical protein
LENGPSPYSRWLTKEDNLFQPPFITHLISLTSYHELFPKERRPTPLFGKIPSLWSYILGKERNEKECA